MHRTMNTINCRLSGNSMNSRCSSAPSKEERNTKSTRSLQPIPVYRISFDLDGGEYEGHTGEWTPELEEGSVITLPELTRSGYIFDHREGSKHYAGETYTVSEDHSFKAIRTKEQKEKK